jgi:predicted dehydrogenase
MSKQTYRVAMIGAGGIVRYSHIPNFQSIPHVSVEAVCDVNEARAEEVATEKGIPRVFTDHQQMLSEVKPDITVIATPNVYHKPMTIDALRAGSHVLCEKPLALTYADAREMLDLAESKGLVLNAGTHYRWSDPMQAAKAHVDAGFFGEIYAVRTVWHRRSGIPGYGSWFTRNSLSGGGSLLDIGIHALDRALYLMGFPQPVTVSGATFSKLGPRGLGLGGWGSDIQKPSPDAIFDVDDLSWAFIRFDTGAVLQLQVSWAVNNKDQFFTEIYGTDGGAVVGSQNDVELYTIMNGQESDIKVSVPKGRTGSYTALVRNFVRYLDGDPEGAIIPAHEALTSVRIIEGVLRSSQEGREVDLTA